MEPLAFRSIPFNAFSLVNLQRERAAAQKCVLRNNRMTLCQAQPYLPGGLQCTSVSVFINARVCTFKRVFENLLGVFACCTLFFIQRHVQPVELGRELKAG